MTRTNKICAHNTKVYVLGLLNEFSEDLGDMLLSYFCFNDFCFLQGWLDLLPLLATG